MPENTLDSLDLAARLGCSVVEIDLRMTLDGEIVLNHDGFMERLTDGIGEADKSYFDELQLMDAGSWMVAVLLGSESHVSLTRCTWPKNMESA